ncbi:TPD1 protein homolog 1-like [Benincasa hispida]|uniref:TPD1 protein homolog 1-like n=1 Tax=Benincasa hispida TaxID=102211 RepID=UPI0019006912|nr:TPD1 protein homolog 1-like [Benincasa hispida]
MVASIKFLCVLFFFCLLSKGKSQCSMNDITISQSTTGKEVNGKQEWRATITNNCVCSQYSVKFDCNGFNSVEKVDESILMVAGSECLVNNGQPMFKSNPISFTYAWDNAFSFKPLFSQVACS